MYPHLLKSFDLGFVTLPNRALMGSMHLGLEEANVRAKPSVSAPAETAHDPGTGRGGHQGWAGRL